MLERRQELVLVDIFGGTLLYARGTWGAWCASKSRFGTGTGSLCAKKERPARRAFVLSLGSISLQRRAVRLTLAPGLCGCGPAAASPCSRIGHSRFDEPVAQGAKRLYVRGKRQE